MSNLRFAIVVPLIILLNIALFGVGVYLIVLLIRALRKYLRSGTPAPEQQAAIRSLGEALKEHRTRLGMTQEFVAEALGVSRQAVSKWETGAADPSTGNLLALADLFGIDAAELLRGVKQ